MACKEWHSAIAPTSYLLLDTVPVALALPAVSVLGISRAVEWNAETPIPLSELLSIHFAASEPEWVLRIRWGELLTAAIVSGTLRIEYVRKDALLSMPSLTRCTLEAFSDVILVDGRPSALVVNIDALFGGIQHRDDDHGIQES